MSAPPPTRRRPNHPSIDGVLAAIRPGRVVRLNPTPEQKRQLRDPEGRLALDVVRHLLGARTVSVPGRPSDRFPLTEAAFLAVARKLGTPVAQKRSRSLTARLVSTGVLVPTGSYRQAYRNTGTSGFHVRLYRLGARVASAALSSKRPVGKRSRVKAVGRVRWHAHALFGGPDCRPPPHLSPAERRRIRTKLRGMRSLDEKNRGFRWRVPRDHSARAVGGVRAGCLVGGAAVARRRVHRRRGAGSDGSGTGQTSPGAQPESPCYVQAVPGAATGASTKPQAERDRRTVAAIDPLLTMEDSHCGRKTEEPRLLAGFPCY
jgi:hypothetical protein